MSYTIDQLLTFSQNFEKRATQALAQITKKADGSGYSGGGGHSGGGGSSDDWGSDANAKTDPNEKNLSLTNNIQVTPPVSQVATSPSNGSGPVDPYIQKALNQLGYSAGKPDAVLGPATRRAINKFKSDRKMSASDTEVFQLIKAEYQRKFPAMQTTYNDPSYNERAVTARKR